MKTTILISVLAFTPLAIPNVNPAGKTVSDRIVVPQGYVRIKETPENFGGFLSRLPVKPHGSRVHYFNGSEKTRDVYCAVLDVPVGKKDLQQCADAVMRLRGEFLYSQKRFEEIHFNFLSDGKPRYFNTFAKGKTDYPTFIRYMESVFVSANTRSLFHELQPVPKISGMKAGDVFIQKGNPFGHAEIILDMAVNPATGKKIYLLAQSYMPAQDIHILKNPMNEKLSPWYELNEDNIQTPEWTFLPTDLRRFRE